MVWRSGCAAAAITAATALALTPSGGVADGPPTCGGHSATATRLAAPTPALAWRAVITSPVPIHAPSVAGLPREIERTSASALLVLGERSTADHRCALRVRLPWRPNGASGWIDSSSVRLVSTPWRIVVDVGSRRVTLLRSGRPVLAYRAVVGKPGTPTPTGTYAIATVWSGPPSGFTGSYILTLTAHSDILAHFDGGDGLVALHGRGGTSLRDPLGSARSHGCIRLANADIDTLVRDVGPDALPGTPVTIR